MSARVVFSAPLKELRHTRVSSACNAVPTTSYPASSVKRDLFGPVDHEENRQWVEQELKVVEDDCRRRWNYDFGKDIPCNIKPHRYEWQGTVGRALHRPEKRQRNDDVNNEHLYYEPEDDPSPPFKKHTTYSSIHSLLPKGQMEQTKITDFLKVKKEAGSHQDKSKKESTVLDKSQPLRPDRSLRSTNIKRWRPSDCRI